MRRSALAGLLLALFTLVGPSLWAPSMQAHAQTKPGSAALPEPSAQHISPEAPSSSPESRVLRWKTALLQLFEAVPSPYKWIGVIVFGLLTLWALMLAVAPLALVKLASVLAPLGKGKLSILEWDIPIDHVLSPFVYRDRVLDHWVAHYAQAAQRELRGRPAFDKFDAYVRAPVELEGHVIGEPTVTDFQALFATSKTRLIIWGAGGSGKTSFACQLAMWALTENRTARLCPRHPMLPVLIDADMALDAQMAIDTVKAADLLKQEVSQHLKEYAGAEVPSRLVDKLLARGRVLLIVDGLSEKTRQTRHVIEQALPARMLVTSRSDERDYFRRVPTTRMQPLQLQGAHLWLFMHAYLGKLGKRNRLSPREFFRGCEQLSMAVGGRDITVWIASLYAEMMLQAVQEHRQDPLPKSIPELMRAYVVHFARSIRADDTQLHAKVEQIARIIAWQCVKSDYRPRPASRQAILRALADDNTIGGSEKAAENLQLLEQELRLVRVEAAHKTDRLQFTLDPLAEYLAALYKVDMLGHDEEEWRTFLFELSDQADQHAEAVGYLLALADCCRSEAAVSPIPDFVVDRLLGLAQVDHSARVTRNIAQRVAFYVAALRLANPEERQAVVEGLGQMGPAARGAVPALIDALEETEPRVRSAVIQALGKLGREAHAALPALRKALHDRDRDVRVAAIVAVYHIGSGVERVSMLAEALDDPHEWNRIRAAMYLGFLGPEAAGVLAPLSRLLEDDSQRVRAEAAEACVRIDRDASIRQFPVITTLVGLLHTEDDRVREEAKAALTQVGREALGTLLAQGHSAPPSVRQAVAEALGELRVDEPEAIAVLTQLLADHHLAVRMAAALSLWKIQKQGQLLLPALRAGLTAPEPETRRQACMVLAYIGPEASEVTAELEQICNDADSRVRLMAGVALWSVTDDRRRLVHALDDSLTATDPWILREAIEAAAGEGETWIPKIIPFTRHANWAVRKAAIEGLLKTGAASSDVLDCFALALEDEDAFIREKAAEGIAGAGVADPHILHVLKAVIVEDEQPRVRFRAARALLRLSGDVTEVFPALLEVYAHEDPWLRQEVVATLGKSGLTAVPFLLEAVHDPEPRVRQEAVDALATVILESPSAMTALVEAARDEHVPVRRCAINGLGRLGLRTPHHLGIFRQGLCDPAASVRWASSRAMEAFGPDAHDALPELLAALDDDDLAVRHQAAEIVQVLGSAAWQAVPVLVEVLQRPLDAWPTTERRSPWNDPVGFKRRIVDALQSILLARGELPPVVWQALKNPDIHVRTAMVEVLGGIGGLGSQAVPELLGALPAAEPPERAAMIRTLGTMPTGMTGVLDALVAALEDEAAEVRLAAVRTLASKGEEAQTGVPALLTCLTRGDAGFAVEAARALWHVCRHAEGIMPTLIDALKDDDSGVRKASAAALEEVGIASADVVLALTHGLQDTDAEVQIAAARALKRMGYAEDQACQTVLDIARGQEASSALTALGHFPGDARAQATLMSVLEDGQAGYQRMMAAEALGELGPTVTNLLPRLRELFQHEKSSVLRWRLAEALGKIGARSHEVIETLIQAAHHDVDADVRQAAVIALGRRDTRPPLVMQALERALGDPHWKVRKAAQEVLQAPDTVSGD